MVKDFSSKQRIAVIALAHGNTVEQSALMAGVTKRTVYRWLNDDGFSQAVNQAASDEIERVSRKLVSAMDEAFDVLVDIMRNSRSGAQRRMAANNIFENGKSIREYSSLEQRVSELERKRDEKR